MQTFNLSVRKFSNHHCHRTLVAVIKQLQVQYKPQAFGLCSYSTSGAKKFVKIFFFKICTYNKGL